MGCPGRGAASRACLYSPRRFAVCHSSFGVRRELGLRHTAVEESLADMARTMLALGLAKARRKEGAGGASGGVGK